ncbi:4998_t:CDS:2 [Entrophospora sp. SA101]|nr:4998_t:CDS:2 [Entrophospora sp. SA101]
MVRGAAERIKPIRKMRKIPNKIFLLELQNRLRENKIKEKELAKILSEMLSILGEKLTFAANEQELSTAYEE